MAGLAREQRGSVLARSAARANAHRNDHLAKKRRLLASVASSGRIAATRRRQAATFVLNPLLDD